MKWLKTLAAGAALAAALVSGSAVQAPLTENKAEAASAYDEVLYFPLDRYPLTGDHIIDSIAAGHSDVCTFDRDGADQNRAESLKGIPTVSGYDRDEWPMAMCEEGGAGADIRYVPYSDNRGSGSWVGNQLEGYPDGTKVLFIVE